MFAFLSMHVRIMIKGWTLKSSWKSFLQILELMSDVSVTRGRSYWNIRPRIFDFFFYQGFLSRTLTTHRTAGKRREPSFCSLCHFHPLPNIQTLTLHMRWFLTYVFNRNACIYQTAIRWGLTTYRPFDWLIWC